MHAQPTDIPASDWRRPVTQRLQLSRAKGWRLPLNAKSVGRPTRWGNEYQIWQNSGDPGWWAEGVQVGHLSRPALVTDMRRFDTRAEAHAHAAEGFRLSLGTPFFRPTVAEIRAKLAGFDLACWCPLLAPDGSPMPCHADILLRVARGEQP
jgi:hypothetical protein